MGVPVGISPDDDVYNGKYLELCKGLNLDKNAAGRAWETYLTVKENYSLDVSRPYPYPYPSPPAIGTQTALALRPPSRVAPTVVNSCL